MIEINQKVQERIANDAESLGNKAANLKELERISQEIKQKLHINVAIPEILPLENETIWTHLQQTSEWVEWEQLWRNFTTQQQGKTDLDANAMKTLKTLQTLGIAIFENHVIQYPELLTYLENTKKQNQNALIMVRSTGKEDSLKTANPGGNESLPAAPNENAISHALGVVIASYISEKSLKQRLLTEDKTTNTADSILEKPFMPVLLQRMVGEPLLGEKDPLRVVKSGVMYTSPTGTRIQVAPGHGELVVNSKASVDTFFVTEENVVHSTIYRKPWRLVPTQEKDGKIKLIPKNNPKELSENASLSNSAALNIAKIGHYIEAHYGIPMDVEFVYEPHPTDPTQDIYHLIQARPIPKGDLKLVQPSSFPPEKMKVLTEKKVGIQKGMVITPAGSAAHVLTNHNQIKIFDTIGEALNFYLDPKNSVNGISPIQAIIIREFAPTTSHEAALFNSKAIPVLQISNTETIESWLKQENPVLVIDPQRSQCVNLSSLVKNHANLEEELYDNKDGFLKIGIYKSPLPAQETLTSPFKNLSEETRLNVINASKDEHHTFPIEQKNAKIGDLIEKTNSKNPDESEKALNQLLPLLFEKLPKSYQPIHKEKFYQNLTTILERLESAKPGENNSDSNLALQELLAAFYQLAYSTEGKKQEGSIHQKIFRQALITGAEVHLALNKLKALKDEQDQADKEQMDFLNLVSQLESLIKNPGNQDLFSDSIFKIAEINTDLKEAEKTEKFSKLTEEQKKYFIEFIKIGKLALKNELASEWTEFAYRCCRNKNNTQKLAHLTQFIIQNKIDSDWLNINFARYSNQKKNKNHISHEEILTSLFKETANTAKKLEELHFTEKRHILNSWRRQIGEWADPKKFDKLLSAYEKELVPLIDELTIDPSQEPLAQKSILKMVQDLTDIMDNTIKSMKGSLEYSDAEREQQVQRFSKLLVPYHKLMQKWVSQIPDHEFENWAKLVLENREINEKKSILSQIESTFNRLKNSNDPNQLNPSGDFSVESATIGSTASFQRQFVEKNNNITLENLFSLMHQNIIKSTVFLHKKTQTKTEDMPPAIQPIIKSLSNGEFKIDLFSIDHQYPIIELKYNLPLRNHSATLSLKHNQKTGNTIIDVKIFGHNLNSRMTTIVKMAELDLIFIKAKTKQAPNYNENSFMLDFSFELNSLQAKESAETLAKMIYTYADITFSPNAVNFFNAGRVSNIFYDTLSSHHSNEKIATVLTELSPEEIEKHKSSLANFIESIDFSILLEYLLKLNGSTYPNKLNMIIRFLDNYHSLFSNRNPLCIKNMGRSSYISDTNELISENQPLMDSYIKYIMENKEKYNFPNIFSKLKNPLPQLVNLLLQEGANLEGLTENTIIKLINHHKTTDNTKKTIFNLLEKNSSENKKPSLESVFLEDFKLNSFFGPNKILLKLLLNSEKIIDATIDFNDLIDSYKLLEFYRQNPHENNANLTLSDFEQYLEKSFLHYPQENRKTMIDKLFLIAPDLFCFVVAKNEALFKPDEIDIYNKILGEKTALDITRKLISLKYPINLNHRPNKNSSSFLEDLIYDAGENSPQNAEEILLDLIQEKSIDIKKHEKILDYTQSKNFMALFNVLLEKEASLNFKDATNAIKNILQSGHSETEDIIKKLLKKDIIFNALDQKILNYIVKSELLKDDYLRYIKKHKQEYNLENIFQKLNNITAPAAILLIQAGASPQGLKDDLILEILDYDLDSEKDQQIDFIQDVKNLILDFLEKNSLDQKNPSLESIFDLSFKNVLTDFCKNEYDFYAESKAKWIRCNKMILKKLLNSNIPTQTTTSKNFIIDADILINAHQSYDSNLKTDVEKYLEKNFSNFPSETQQKMTNQFYEKNKALFCFVIGKNKNLFPINEEIYQKLQTISPYIIETLVTELKYPVDFNYKLAQDLNSLSFLENLMLYEEPCDLWSEPTEDVPLQKFLIKLIQDNNIDLTKQTNILDCAISKNFTLVLDVLLERGAPLQIKNETIKNSTKEMLGELMEKIEKYKDKYKKENLSHYQTVLSQILMSQNQSEDLNKLNNDEKHLTFMHDNEKDKNKIEKDLTQKEAPKNKENP